MVIWRALVIARRADDVFGRVCAAGIACWFGYGLFLKSWPMIVSNAITFLLSSTILGLKLKHK